MKVYNLDMKKFLKIKYLVIAAGVLLILLAGGFIYIKNKKENKVNTPEAKTEQPATNDQKTIEKTDNPQAEVPKNPDEGKPTPVINNSVGSLDGVFLTAYLYSNSTTSMDGKTTVPANSIQPYLFPQGSGVYSVQKLSGTSWLDVASNISYSGHGGIAGAYAGPSEDNINYRLVKIENGKAVSISKTFVVKRSDLSGGVKTYN
jgi:hypothetical protein